MSSIKREGENWWGTKESSHVQTERRVGWLIRYKKVKRNILQGPVKG